MAETIDSTKRTQSAATPLRGRAVALAQRWLRGNSLFGPATIALAAALTATLAVHNITFLLYIEQVVADVRTAWQMPAEAQDPNVVIVALDEDTLQQFPYRSPVDRGFLAELIRYIAKLGPRAIAVDVLFDQPTEPDKDEALRQALHELRIPIIVSYTDDPALVNEDQRDYLNEFVPRDARAMATLGTDPSDTARRIYPGKTIADGSYVPGFARALVGKLGIATTAEEADIVWHGKGPKDDHPFAMYSAKTLRFLKPGWLAGKIVLIGASESLNDRHRTPFASVWEGNKGFLPGIEIHAHSVSQLLTGRPSDQVGWPANFAIALVLGMIGALVGKIDLPVALRIAASALVIGTFIVVGFRLFYYARAMIELVTPSLSLALAAWTSDSLGHREARKQRAYIQQVFSRYVSAKVVTQLIEDPTLLRLDRRVMTFIFTDVAGFTTLAEAVGSEVLANVLNTYLEGVCNVIHRHDGTVDKFIGDAVFCIFNAPTEQPDHRERAVRCALEIDAYAERFREAQNAAGIPVGVTRIGVHGGEATVGEFGSPEKKEYTALGDPVNTASRLEGLNKYLGTRVCVSDVIKDGCPNLRFRPIGLITLKGKAKPTAVFEPLPDDVAESDYTRRYEEAYRRLERRDPGAIELFRALHEERPEDGPVALHLERLQGGESGVEIVMTEK